MVSWACFLASSSNQIPEIANKADVRIPHTREICTTGKTHHHTPTTLNARDVEMVLAGCSVRSDSNWRTSEWRASWICRYAAGHWCSSGDRLGRHIKS